MRTPRGHPRSVSASPDVARSIQSDIRARELTSLEIRMPKEGQQLAIPSRRSPGVDEGVFYPPEAEIEAHFLGSRRADRRTQTTGTLRCLALLVDFPDQMGRRAPDDLHALLFSKGERSDRSMRDFYAETSYGQLDIDGEVAGWFHLPQPYSEYVGTKSGMGDYPRNSQRMVEDALSIASESVDFGRFDADADTYLDALLVIHSGSGAEEEDDKERRAHMMWSHQWYLRDPLVVGGVTVYQYAAQPEDGTLGVFCHEFGHVLGLPDLYDITYRSKGVGLWCLMGTGSWNQLHQQGDTPGHLCVWSKARLNWIDPEYVSSSRSVSISPIELGKDDTAYRLWTEGRHEHEYFLVENRVQQGFDVGLPGSGLLVWHVDDNEHNNDHPGGYWVGLRQADARLDLEYGDNVGDAGDPYPGDSGNESFGDKTVPSAVDKYGRATGVTISQIAMSEANLVTCRIDV